AENIFYEIDQVTKEVEEINALERGYITIGSAGNQLIYSSIVSFHQEYPNINISVIDATTKDTMNNILNSTFDLGVVFLPVYDNKLESHYLFTSELYMICSNDHELKNLSSISLSELQQYPVFLLQKNFFIRQLIDQVCQNSGVQLVPKVELS